MFSFLKKEPVKGSARPVDTKPASDSGYPSQQHANVRRELIRVVLKDTLRVHGIPLEWLACEVISVLRGPNQEEVHVQLVIRKWSEQLLRFSMAFQKALLLDLDRFDPSVAHSDYVVSWRFAPDCVCPFPFMPNPDAWHEKATPVPKPEVNSLMDRRRSRRPPNIPGELPLRAQPQPAPASYAPTTLPAPEGMDDDTPTQNYAPTALSPLR